MIAALAEGKGVLQAGILISNISPSVRAELIHLLLLFHHTLGECISLYLGAHLPIKNYNLPVEKSIASKTPPV